MLNYLKDIDTKLLLAINGMHSPNWDSIMIAASGKLVWIPFYALIVAFIIYRYRQHSLLVLIIIALLITASDQLTSGFMKPFFERLRPCHEPALTDLLYLPHGCGGQFGFASSHAANSFAAATFLWLLMRSYFKWMWLLFAWAFVICYSRIYLAAHYPGDVLVGMLIGILLAIVFFKIYTLLRVKFSWQIKAG